MFLSVDIHFFLVKKNVSSSHSCMNIKFCRETHPRVLIVAVRGSVCDKRVGSRPLFKIVFAVLLRAVQVCTALQTHA